MNTTISSNDRRRTVSGMIKSGRIAIIALVLFTAGAAGRAHAQDTQAPAPGNGGTITILNNDITSTSIRVKYTTATDNVEESLSHYFFYSTSGNIQTAAACEENGHKFATFNTTYRDIERTLTVNNLSPDTTYYFNIVVTDAAGNKVAYTMTSAKTLPLSGNR